MLMRLPEVIFPRLVREIAGSARVTNLLPDYLNTERTKGEKSQDIQSTQCSAESIKAK